SYANEHRAAALFEDLFSTSLNRFREQQGMGARKAKFRFKNKLLSLDSTTISLCLDLFHACELGTATVGSSGGEVPAALRLHDAKHVSRAAPFILVVLLGQFPRFGRYRRSHVSV